VHDAMRETVKIHENHVNISLDEKSSNNDGKLMVFFYYSLSFIGKFVKCFCASQF
jgi:hypothetical protein